MPESSSNSEESRKIEGKTPHAEQRSQEAQEGDIYRQVGDLTESLEKVGTLEIRKLALDVYVRGDEVVIVDPATNQQITQFKNSRANTQKRIESGRWKPIP